MAAHQAPQSLGFPRQEHWSGLSFPSPMLESEKGKWSRSVVSDSSRPQGLQPTRLLRPWDFPGKSTGVGCHRLLRRKSTHGNKNKSISCGTVPGLNNDSVVQREPYCLSGKSKRGPPKVYQSGFRLLQGTSDFKVQIPISMCIRHQDKVTTAPAAGP